MGLFGGKDKKAIWDDGEDEEKYALARELLEALRGRHGGEVLRNREDDELFELRFEAQGRPTRILLDASFSGDIEIETKFTNRRGVVKLDWDEDLMKTPADPIPRKPPSALNPWAKEDAEDLKYHLGGGVYVAEFAGQGAGMLKVIDDLTEDVRDVILRGVADLRLDEIIFDHDQANLSLYDELSDLDADPEERIEAALGLLAWGVEAFERGSRQVDPRIRVVIAGQPFSGKLNITRCPSCQKVVNLGGGPFCPACGVRHA